VAVGIGRRLLVPVIIHGAADGAVTRDGRGSQVFPSLTEARRVFPDLNLEFNTPRFTAAGLLLTDDVFSVGFWTWEACGEEGLA
jgi:hypothetical protein